MSGNTPVNYYPIAEITPSQPHLLDVYLEQTLTGTMTGFIVRSNVEQPTSEQAANIHRQQKDKLHATVSNLRPYTMVKPHEMAGFNGLGNKPIGKFHHDSNTTEIKGNTPRLNAHTTLSGGGDVLLASMGKEPKLALAGLFGSGALWSELNRRTHPHSLLLRDLVNPLLTSPDIYTGKVAAGDTIIFPETGPHGCWHRFDTDKALGRRTVLATLFSPVS